MDAACLGGDDMEAADAAVEVVRPDGPLEAVALVDDLDEEAVVVELGAERDLPFGRGGSVGDQFTGEQLRVVQLRLSEVESPATR